MRGRILKGIAGFYYVETRDLKVYECKAKGIFRRSGIKPIVGDNVEVGCNSVLNPGTVIGRGTNVYPLSMVRGAVPPGSIYKKQGEVVQKR